MTTRFGDRARLLLRAAAPLGAGLTQVGRAVRGRGVARATTGRRPVTAGSGGATDKDVTVGKDSLVAHDVGISNVVPEPRQDAAPERPAGPPAPPDPAEDDATTVPPDPDGPNAAPPTTESADGAGALSSLPTVPLRPLRSAPAEGDGPDVGPGAPLDGPASRRVPATAPDRGTRRARPGTPPRQARPVTARLGRRGLERLGRLGPIDRLRHPRPDEQPEVPSVDDPDAPTSGPSVPDDGRVLRVLDLAIRVGEVLLSSGEAVAETTTIMLRLADLSGLPSCEVDITFTSITMSCHRGNVALPITTMRLVQYRSLDLTRLDEVAKLVHRFEQHTIGLDEAAAQLDAITRARHPYPRWLATLAYATMAASVAALLGAGWAAALVAFFATGAIDRIGRLLNRRGLPMFFQQLVGALLATGFTAGLLYFNVLPINTAPSLVIAAAITVLLSGLSVVGAVRDAIDGFPLTATGRAAEIAMYSAGLLAGVVLALKGADHFGIQLTVAAPLPASAGSTVLRLLAAGLASGCFALAGYAPVRFLPATAGAGLASWGFYTLFQHLGLGPVAATGLAAIGLGAFAGNMHRYVGVPSLVLTIAGITPLLPGFTAYRGFYELAVAGASDGVVTIMVALATGLALAGGVALGEWLTTTLHGDADRGSSLVTIGGDGR